MKNLASHLTAIVGIALCVFFHQGMLIAQTQCDNYPPILGNSNIGIHTIQTPGAKPLEISGTSSACWDPAIRLSFQQPFYWGHLVLITPINNNTPPIYSSIAASGDIVLQNDRNAENASQNLVLATRNYLGNIKFSTTILPSGPDAQRMNIAPDGKIWIGPMGSYTPSGPLLTICGDARITTLPNGAPDIYHYVVTADENGYLGKTESSSLLQDAWLITGNSNTNSTNFLGTTTHNPLIFKTHNVERMRIWDDNSAYDGRATYNHKTAGGYPIGFFDINLSQDYGYQWELPKISFFSNGSEPGIRFYRQNPESNNLAHTWRIYQNWYNLEFLSLIDPVEPGATSGNNPDNPNKIIEFQRDGTVIFWDNSYPDYTNDKFPTDDTKAKLLWIPQKVAFRSGQVTGSQWNLANIGLYSAAFGYDNKASGEGATSFGEENIASATGATAFGESNQSSAEGATSFGAGNTSSAYGATAFGEGNASSAYGATSYGLSNSASAEGSTAGGELNFATDKYTVSLGYWNTASAEGAASFGEYNTSSGIGATSFGLSNTASAEGATSSGEGNTSSGKGATTFGLSNTASAEGAFATGEGNTASGNNSAVFGYNCQALGHGSFTTGELSSSNGANSIAMGTGAVAYYDGANAIGFEAKAINAQTYAFGSLVTASGLSSTALGTHVSTNNFFGSFIIGDATVDPNPLTTPFTWSDKPNQMTMRFQGDQNNCIDADNACFRLITHVGKDVPENGLYLFHSGHGWLGYSDSNMKRDIVPVNIDSFLIKMCNIPISTWKWKPDSVMINDSTMIYDSLSYTWLGPMAQTFYQEFPIGVPNNCLLSETVLSGVTFAGVQALKKITDSIHSNVENGWHKSGDSISSSDFIGTTNNEPLIFKTNSQEKIRITDNQVIFNVTGTLGDTTEYNAAIKFYSDTTFTNGVFMAGGECGWRAFSDKNKKENFQSIDGNKILESIGKISVTTWNYKYAPINIRYIGPMAQDFYHEFQLGGSDSLSINSLIFDGINFAGIQALKFRSDSLKIKIDSSVSKNEFYSFRDSLNSKVGDLSSSLNSSLTKNEFYSFKDSISCYSDACNKIKELQDEISDLKSTIDSLKTKLGGIVKGKDEQNQTLQNTAFDDIILEQNNPNPFAEESKINYYIPQNFQGIAKLILANENGSHIYQQFDICNGKPCQLIISARDLKTGVYLYGIELNGTLIKSKKMMIIK